MSIYADNGYIRFSNQDTFEGLKTAFHDIFGSNGYFDSELCLEVGFACYLSYIIKYFPDLPYYFPRGQWSTKQALQDAIDQFCKDAIEIKVSTSNLNLE